MSVIAERLDQKLKSLPPAKAASVERLVWDVLQVVDFEPASRAVAVQEHEKHVAECLKMTAEMDWSDFERPEQGVSEKREEW